MLPFLHENSRPQKIGLQRSQGKGVEGCKSSRHGTRQNGICSAATDMIWVLITHRWLQQRCTTYFESCPGQLFEPRHPIL